MDRGALRAIVHGVTNSWTTERLNNNKTSAQKKEARPCDGRKIGTQTGRHVFTFKVQNLGEMKLEAVAGELRDTAVIRHVTKPNMSYKLPKDGGNGGNWT